jgi:predicted dehydrogenase
VTPLRLGLAGFGRLARDYYLPALRAAPDVRLVAVADPLPESRAAAAVRCPGAHVYETLSAMLDGAALDALLVASPPSAHLAAWRAASTARIPAFVEKPILLSHELPLLDGREDGARVMVDFNRRFWPPYVRARAIVAAGTLGTPLHLDFRLHLDVLGWSTVTRHRLAADEGGLAHDLGCHAIDLASWLLGEEPREVTAVASTRRWRDDHLRLGLAFPSGATADADLAHGARTRERLGIRGPGGRLWQDEPNMALHLERAGARRGRLAAKSLDMAVLAYRALRRSRSVGRASIQGALDAFVRAVRTGGPFEPGVADGLRNARWVAAAVRSAAAGGASARP